MLLQHPPNSRDPVFFTCDDCGSAVESEDQTTNRRRCIFSGERTGIGGTVYTKCLVCNKKKKVESNCVYRSFVRTKRREATLPKERIEDPTFACVEMTCVFDTCPSNTSSSKKTLVTYQKVEDDAFRLLYTCHSCRCSWEV